MIAFPNSKINIGLNVVSKRADGYHNIETVFYPVNIQDALEINLMKPNLKKVLEGESVRQYTLSMSGAKFSGSDDDNLVVKAYSMMLEDFQLPPININLYKHIPVGAGLGGGSSDCASMIMLLNKRFGLRLTDACMERYAARLGSDCAFFIKNRPVFATGKGEVMSPIGLSLAGYTLLMVKPDISVSTKDAYENVIVDRPQVPLKYAITRPISEWKDIIFNDFEKSVFRKYPQMKLIKQRMYQLGAAYASMTGSGSAIYGIFSQSVETPQSLFPDMFCCQRELL